MYATCLYCNAPFEKNESLGAFPVGRRIAFDEAKGRLWVVCRKCERWSLSPLDERWEAIEQAERLYRDARKRVATDNIGLAKVSEGTTLIRIGEPLRPEFAAWRYGDQFGRRRRKQMLITGAGVTAVGALLVGGFASGVSVGSFGWLFGKVAERITDGSPDTVVATHQGQSSATVAGLPTAPPPIVHIPDRVGFNDAPASTPGDYGGAGLQYDSHRGQRGEADRGSSTAAREPLWREQATCL